MRIGFLLNHDQIHQVAHSFPIALALARSGTGHDVSIAVSNDALAAEVERLGGAALRRAGVTIHRLGLRSAWRRGIAALAADFIPSEKLLIYGDNLDYFRNLDVLVVTEKTSLLLRRFAGLEDLAIIHTRHGAGDRAIGFDRSSTGFDLILVSGEKIQRRLVADAGVAPDRIRIVGYPKFDLEPCSPAPFANDEATVILYNPHVSPHLSSWYDMGRAVLDWFVDNPRYRLIFAPHVMLFHRRMVVTIDRLRIDRPGTIPKHIRNAPNIHVDLGSAASTDMTYTRRADLYLGDVSSQVYEFLQRPRPCIFLDAHRTRWQDDPNYAHWKAGRVIGQVDQLGEAIRAATASHDDYFASEQRWLLAATFDLTAEASSIRAARAIAAFAGDTAAHGVSRGDAAPAPGRRRSHIAGS